MSTLHCALENGADLYVNERQKIRQDCARSTKEKKKKEEKEEEEECQIGISLLRMVHMQNALYSKVIHSFDWKSAIEHDGGV